MRKKIIKLLYVFVLIFCFSACTHNTTEAKETVDIFENETSEQITNTLEPEPETDAPEPTKDTDTNEKEIEIELPESAPAVTELVVPYIEMTAEELLSDRNGTKPSEGYNTLQDIELITEKIIDGSIGFSSLDNKDTFDKWRSSLIPSSIGMLVIRNWNTTDLSAYLPNGFISMFVKGEQGGETFDIGLQDCNRDRPASNDSVTVYTNSEDYCSITTKWQQVKIPLKDFFNENNNLDVSSVWTVNIGNSNGKIKMANVRISSPDKESCENQIKINQLGYSKNAAKYAYVSGFYEDILCNTKTSFSVIDSKNGNVVYNGYLTLVCGYDANYSGGTIYKADFSDFTYSGSYYLSINLPEPLLSSVFNIQNHLYGNHLGTLCKYYYFQRANIELTEEFAGEFAREPLYPSDKEMVFLSDKTKTKDVSGGWFDAGDFGKYVDPASVAVTDLLWAYKLFPDVFPDGISNIPESGNGTSDLLDEVKIELDFILKMQDNDGGFFHRVNPDDGTRAIVDTFSRNDGGNIKAAGTTANAVAALSLAYTVYKDISPDYARTLLDASKKGWDYAVSHPGITSTGTYGNAKSDHQLFYAACAMYYATNDEVYHDYIKKHYTKFASAYSGNEIGHSSDNMKRIAYATYLASENKDASVKAFISKKFTSWKTSVLQTAKNNPWNTPLADWAFWWGSNSNALNTGMELYLTEYFLDGNTLASQTLTAQTVNFIFGINPLSKSLVTGMGENCIKRTYSGIFGTDEIPEFPAGFTSGGINNYDGKILSRFPLKCFTDTAVDWVTNENSIYYQSALIFATAMQAHAEKQ